MAHDLMSALPASLAGIQCGPWRRSKLTAEERDLEMSPVGAGPERGMGLSITHAAVTLAGAGFQSGLHASNSAHHV
jgi:hypothetical protein